MPSAAIRELENDADYLVSTILSLRSFERAKQAYDSHCADRNPKKRPLPKSQAIDLVKEIEFRVAREDIDAAKNGGST